MDKFRRVENKYMFNEEVYNKLISKIKYYIKEDIYPKYTICNIYMDNNNFDLINNSIEKPLFKEKVRIRSYGNPKLNDNVYLEVKKKFDGVVSKRRTKLKLKDLYKYLSNDLDINGNQNFKEIDYIIKKYLLKPKYYIAYDRIAFLAKDNNELRITFDTNIRSRTDYLRLELGDSGKLLFKDKKYIMEVKTIGSIPLWLSHILSELKIYPCSFSKYGSIYEEGMKENV